MRTKSNTHLETGWLFSLPSEETAEDLPLIGNTAEQDYKRDLLARLKAEGKELVPVCCNDTKDALEAALEFGLEEAEFWLFVNFFRGHRITDFAAPDYIKNGIDINQVITRIFETADLLPREALQSHFLESAYQDVQRRNKASWKAGHLLTFNKLFRERLAHKPPEASPKYAADQFGEGLAEVVKEALEKKGLLAAGGRFIGSKTQIKALYSVLVFRGWIGSDHSTKKAFAAFVQQFGKTISPRALYDRNNEQAEEERDFMAIIHSAL